MRRSSLIAPFVLSVTPVIGMVIGGLTSDTVAAPSPASSLNPALDFLLTQYLWRLECLKYGFVIGAAIGAAVAVGAYLISKATARSRSSERETDIAPIRAAA